MGSIDTRCRKREHGKLCDGVSRPEGANARTAPSDRLGIVSHGRRAKWSEELEVGGKNKTHLASSVVRNRNFLPTAMAMAG